MSRLAQIMTANPITILETATVVQASTRMQENGLRHLPVVDQVNRLVGIISDRDLRGPMVGCTGTVPSTTTSVSAIMTRSVITARDHDPLHIAARLMIEHRVGAILVTNRDGGVCGVVSYVDVLQNLVEDAAFDQTALELMDRE